MSVKQLWGWSRIAGREASLSSAIRAGGFAIVIDRVPMPGSAALE